MSSVNKVILVGNLGRNPEVRAMQSGKKVATLSIATSEFWKDKNTGERKEKTQWHKVVIFNEGLVRIAEQYLNKGSKVYIEGQLETRKWQDQSGQDKYTTEVVLRNYGGSLVMLDSRNDSNNEVGYKAQAPEGSDNPFSNRNKESWDNADLDDDVPF